MVGPQVVRRLALALPATVEADHHGFPSFRVAGSARARRRTTCGPTIAQGCVVSGATMAESRSGREGS
ncbi:MAG TPA: hypothetical protein VFF36_03425, partial [Planctomycetota bacterium]|nr:hypothetical protein [Planctomycetota bacterium]